MTTAADRDEAIAKLDIIEAAGDAIRDDEAVARFRSARSTKTGPGSRGGHWHDPMYRAGYRAGWRQSHPEYRALERERVAERRRLRALARDRAKTDRLALPRTKPLLDFARWLAARLAERGMSQSELADFAGTSQSVISRLLRNKRAPDLTTVMGIVAALGYDIDFVKQP